MLKIRESMVRLRSWAKPFQGRGVAQGSVCSRALAQAAAIKISENQLATVIG